MNKRQRYQIFRSRSVENFATCVLNFIGQHIPQERDQVTAKKLNPDMNVSDFSAQAVGKEFLVDEQTTISDFEDYLSNELGLNAQVFRRSGNLWLQTTKTDSWSLHEANRKGGHSQELANEQSDT